MSLLQERSDRDGRELNSNRRPSRDFVRTGFFRLFDCLFPRPCFQMRLHLYKTVCRSVGPLVGMSRVCKKRMKLRILRAEMIKKAFKVIINIKTALYRTLKNRHISTPRAAKDQCKISICSIFSADLYPLLHYSLTVIFLFSLHLSYISFSG